MSRRHRTKDIDRLVQRLDTLSLSSTAASVEPPPAVPAQPFRFFDLPSELRLRVYELLLVVPHTLDLDPSNTRTLAPSLRLLLASKRVESEASRVFYGRNTFRIFPIHGKYINKKHPLLAWLPRRYRSYITRLELRLGPGFTRPPKGWVVTPRLGLAAATRVYRLKIFVEIDPEANDVFAGFRVGSNFYTEYCVVLLRALLVQLPSVGEVEMDAYPGVGGDSPLIKALVGEAKLNQKRLVWGEGRSWDGIVDGDLAGALGRLGM